MKDHQTLLLDILEKWERTDGYAISQELNEALNNAYDFIIKEKN